MYRVIKVLNNNGILALDDGTKREVVFLGNGVGFGRKTGERLESISGAKIYGLINRSKTDTALKVINGIDPVYLEITGKIIEEAEKEFGEVNRDILLPLADHIALAVKRSGEGRQIANPFTPDIKVLFHKEFAIALKARDIIQEMTGHMISEDEAGFITLHIRSSRTDEKVSEALDAARIIGSSIGIIEEKFNVSIPTDSLGYNRLTSHLYYMILRVRKGEKLKVDINQFVQEKYPLADECARKICEYIRQEIKREIMEEEKGFLGIHIQRIIGNE